MSKVTGVEKWPEGKGSEWGEGDGVLWVGWSLRSDLWNEGMSLWSWKREECFRDRVQEAQVVSATRSEGGGLRRVGRGGGHRGGHGGARARSPGLEAWGEPSRITGQRGRTLESLAQGKDPS